MKQGRTRKAKSGKGKSFSYLHSINGPKYKGSLRFRFRFNFDRLLNFFGESIFLSSFLSVANFPRLPFLPSLTSMLTCFFCFGSRLGVVDLDVTPAAFSLSFDFLRTLHNFSLTLNWFTTFPFDNTRDKFSWYCCRWKKYIKHRQLLKYRKVSRKIVFFYSKQFVYEVEN